jgi:hypothetical protein
MQSFLHILYGVKINFLLVGNYSISSSILIRSDGISLLIKKYFVSSFVMALRFNFFKLALRSRQWGFLTAIFNYPFDCQ